MAYSKIEQAYLDGLVQAQFPDPVELEPTLLASADTGITTDGGAYVGTRLNMPKGLNTPENMQAVGNDIPKTVAGVAKGMAQGFVGLPGDLEGIGRLVLNYMGADVNEQTKLPTTQDVKGFLDQYIKLPELQTGDMSNFETAGEWLAPGGQLKAVKPVAKAIKGAVKMTEGLPVGLSIKAFDGTEAVLEKAPKIETKAFKNWFGDSKVTSGDGKPLVVYHGTDGNFEEFRPGFKGSSENETTKLGFWFTDDPSTAEDFSVRTSNEYVTKKDPNTGDVMRWEDGKPKEFRAPDTKGSIMPVYLSIKKPMVFETKGDVDAFEQFMDFRDQWAQYINGEKGVQGAWRKRYVALDTEKTNKEFLNYLSENGFDGVVLKNTMYDAMGDKPITQYLVTDPTKIKSAIGNKGTFDPKDPSIVNGAIGTSGASAATQQNQEKK